MIDQFPDDGSGRDVSTPNVSGRYLRNHLAPFGNEDIDQFWILSAEDLMGEFVILDDRTFVKNSLSEFLVG